MPETAESTETSSTSDSSVAADTPVADAQPAGGTEQTANAQESVPEGKEEGKGEAVAEKVDAGKSELPADLAKQAKEYGLDEGILKAMGDKAEAFVKQFARAYDKMVADIGRNEMNGQQPVQAQQQQPVEADKKQEAQKAAPEQEKKQESAGFELPPLDEDYGEDVKSAFGKTAGELNDHRRAIGYLLGELNDLRARMQSVLEDNSLSEFDTIVNSADEKYAALLGKGRTQEMAPDSKERKFRESLLQQMDALAIGYRRQGKNVQKIEQFHKALNILAHDHIGAIEREAIKKEVTKRQKGVTHNPAKRTGSAVESPAEGKAAAISDIARLMKELGTGEPESVDAAMASFK